MSKKLLKCCEWLNIDNVNFPLTIIDIEQFEKDNPDIAITTFEYGSFHQIKEDDNNNENTKEGTVIKDVRVSPYASKRKHLVELLIIKDNEKKNFTVIKSISRLYTDKNLIKVYTIEKNAIVLLSQKKY